MEVSQQLFFAAKQVKFVVERLRGIGLAGDLQYYQRSLLYFNLVICTQAVSL
jgi:hypothetical protein